MPTIGDMPLRTFTVMTQGGEELVVAHVDRIDAGSLVLVRYISEQPFTAARYAEGAWLSCSAGMPDAAVVVALEKEVMAELQAQIDLRQGASLAGMQVPKGYKN